MPVPSPQAAKGKAERKKCTKTFHTQLDPRWPDLQSLWAKWTIKYAKAPAVLFQQQAQNPSFEPNRFRNRSLHQGPPASEYLVVIAAEKAHLYEVKTLTSTIRRRNCVHLTPLPKQKQHQPKPNKTNTSTTVTTDIADAKVHCKSTSTYP